MTNQRVNKLGNGWSGFCNREMLRIVDVDLNSPPLPSLNVNTLAASHQSGKFLKLKTRLKPAGAALPFDANERL